MKNLKHYNSNATVVEISGRIYRFTPKYNVSLCEGVPDDDADKILAIMTDSCCGNKKHKFSLANANDISIWHTGHLP